MDPRTARYLVFVGVNVAALWLGYLARRRGWLHEDASRRIHFHTFVWVWSVPTFLGIWTLVPRAEHLWYLALQPVIMLLGAYGVLPLARRLGSDRGSLGVLALAAGQGNTGTTLGAYLCYCLVRPAEQAFGLGIAVVAIMQAWAVFLIFPLARRYGEGQTASRSLPALVRDNFLDLRAMTFWAALAGLAARGLTGGGPPERVAAWHVMEVFVYLAGLGTYFGIGLRLRLGDALRHLREHTLLAAMKFAAVPGATALLLWAISRSPWSMDATGRQVFQIEAFIPTATATVILANLFRLDARAASALWLWNTAIFLVGPLPALLWWYG